jgi:ubiquinone/menaquinone biosynthesis C-methylase UbiE
MAQRLGSYLDNIYRDWSWGDENGENQASVDILKELLDEPPAIQNLLVLGAGGCRLAYDFHRIFKPALTLASDINPLYLLIAQEVISGAVKPLYEFPVAPSDGKSFFVRRELKAPTALTEGFYFLFADGMNPPFPAGSFDALLTPWFIDIVPQDPLALFRRFNFVLKTGGIWTNFGSCYFNHPDYSRRYSPEEILEVAELSGFEIIKSLKKRIPYIQSPSSAHGRVEQTFSFVARKVREVEQPPRFVYLPDWLSDPSKPIPQSASFKTFTAVHSLYTQIVGAIDGKISLEALAQALGPRYGLSVEDAVQSFGRFLMKVYESG